MVPNMYCTLGEMDMFLLRRSGYAEEFEIKVSTADLRADFKKRRKHGIFLNQYNKVVQPKYGPNRFSYVISDDVNIEGIELPTYAGLYVVRNDKLVCLQSPKLIHKRKWDWHRKVAGSCSHRLLRAYKMRY